MPDPNKNIEAIWNFLNNNHEVPPLDEFVVKMKKPENVEKIRKFLVDNYTSDPVIGQYTDSAAFAQKMGLSSIQPPDTEQAPESHPKTFSMPTDIGKFKSNKSGFSVPSDKAFTTIPQGFMGAEGLGATEKEPLKAAYQVARKAEMLDLGESNDEVKSRLWSTLVKPFEPMNDVPYKNKNEEESKSVSAEFQNYVKYLTPEQRSQIKGDIESSNIKDTLKNSFLYSLREDVTPVVKIENVVQPQDTMLESAKSGLERSTKDYALLAKILYESKKRTINQEDVDTFIDDMYNKFIGYDVPTKNEKEVAREALGIEQNLSGAVGNAAGRLPAFFGEMAIVNSATGGSGSIAQVFSGASKTMKIIGGLTEEAIKMGLQQSVFEGSDFEEGAKMGAAYYSGGQITGAIFGHTLATKLMQKGMSARMAGKSVAAIQSGTGAALGGAGLHLAGGEGINSNNVAIDAMMGTVIGLFHTNPNLRKQAINRLTDNAVKNGVIEPGEAREISEAVFNITSDAANLKDLAMTTAETIRKSKGKDFAKVIDQPIDIQSDFPLKNVSETLESKQEVKQQTTTNEKEATNGQEKEVEKEKGVLNPSDVTEVIKPEQETTGVSKTVQAPIETKSSDVVRARPEDIKIDEPRFQNRTKLDEDVLKQIVENYSDQEMDAIKVWKDPNDNQMYLLAGHHRLEAAKRKGVSDIKIEEFRGTEQEAITYATERSNANRSMETELDRAKIYRKMREAGSNYSEMSKKAEIEGKNKSRVLAFSYLNPEGKTADSLKSVPSSSDQYNTVRQIAQWVGEARKLFPELSNSHENEIFDYLLKGGQSIFGNKTDFIDRVGNLVDRIDFDKTKPLNIANRVSKADIEIEFDQRVAEAQKEFDRASRELNDFRKRAIDQGLIGNTLEKALKPYNDAVVIAQRDLLNVKSQKSSVKEAAKTQTDIFSSDLDNIEKQLNEGAINENQAGTLIQNIESKIGIESEKESGGLGKEREYYDEKNREAISASREAYRTDVQKQTTDVVDKAFVEALKELDDPDIYNKIHEMAKKGDGAAKSLIIEYDKESLKRRLSGDTENAASSKYVFADIPVETNPTLQIHPIQTMEALELLRNNGLVPVVKEHLGKALGYFSPVGNGKIKLARVMFLPGNETQLVKTMFHEIGHWINWMPDKFMGGNLAVKLRSMAHGVKESFEVSNTEFMKELKALSKEWRPWDETNASVKEIKYRNSSKEIYADFISALFNNPGYVKRVAPKSFDTFFKYLDRKPTIKSNYFEIQKIYNGGFESVVAHRDASVGNMFDQTDYTAAELQSLREAEMERRKKSWVFRASSDIVDMNNYRQKQVEKAQRANIKAGLTPNEELKDILPFTRDLNYIDRKQESIVREVELISDEARDNNLDWKDYGRLMLYERITKGDRYQNISPEDYFALTGEMVTNDLRVDLHNPRGLNKQTAQELLDYMKQRLGDEKYNLLNNGVNKIRSLLGDVIDFAYESDLISSDKHAQFKANPYYAPFQVSDYVGESISPHFYSQLGTFKDIRNPADAALLKMLVLSSAAIKNRARVANIEFEREYHPEDIVETVKDPKTGAFEPVDKNKAYGLEPITYMKNGEPVTVYVDPYVKDILTLNKPLAGNAVQRAMSVPNLISKTAMLTLSAGWQLSNHFFMDTAAYWRKSPSWNLPKMMKNRFKAYGPALAYAFNLKKSKHYQESLKMLDEMVLGDGFKDLTYETLVQGETPADRHIHEVLYNSGIGSFRQENLKKNKLIEPLLKAYAFANQFTAFADNVAKAQGYYDMTGTPDMRPGEVRDWIRRNAGTPAFRESGKMANVINPLMLFASSAISGMNAEFQIATNPKTRSGYWAKTATQILAPHIIMLAAEYGYQYLTEDQKKKSPFLGDLSKMFKNIPEYDKTNKLCVPVGWTSEGKVAYYTIPFDPSGRMIGAIFHKAIGSQVNKQPVGEMLADVLTDIYGGLPTINPTLKSITDGVQFLTTGNVFDPFRGKMVLPENMSGMRANKLFAAYVFEQMGGATFVKPYINSRYSFDIKKTPGEKIIGLPMVGPMVSRFYKESNRGVSEYLESITKNIDRKQAEQVFATNDAITRFVRSGKMSANELFDSLEAEGVDLTDPLEPHRIEMKLKAALIRGESDPFMNALIDAGVEKRITIINEAKNFMADEEYIKYLKQARAFGLLPK